MRKSIYFFLVIVLCGFQSDKDKELYQAFLDRQFGSRHKNLGEFEESVKNLDFSKIWTTKELKKTNIWVGVRPEPLGYIGTNKQRFYIHFTSIQQSEIANIYKVKGKSKVKSNICDFEGQFVINDYQEFTRDYHEGADYVINPKTFRTGVITGTYELKEDPKQKFAGTFQGVFTSSFFIDEQGKIDYCVAEIFSDNFINNQFEGTWTTYTSNNSKVCNWGDFRIPKSDGLDMGAGGFSPSDSYLKYGWQTYRDVYWSTDPRNEARKLEQTAWWNE